jgi:DHA2 family multidrug resistance protein
MFMCAPIVGRLLTKVDARILIGFGMIEFALGAWLAADITKDWDFWELLVPQLLRGSALITCMVAINSVAIGSLPQAEMKNASGLYNLTRNLGGAVGLALINTTLNDRMDLHLTRLHEQVSANSVRAQDWMSTLGGAFGGRMGPIDANLAAMKQMAQFVRREALVMALSDVFLSASRR